MSKDSAHSALYNYDSFRLPLKINFLLFDSIEVKLQQLKLNILPKMPIIWVEGVQQGNSCGRC